MDDPYARAMRQMIDVFAELERGLIVARTKAALAVKKSKGERWCNEAPFGFRWNGNNELVPNAKEQRTVALVKKLRKDGVTFRGIVAELKKQRRYNRVGEPIALSHVQRILKRG